MKLQSRYNRAIITATIFVLLSGSFAYYFLIRYALIHQLDEALRVEEQEIRDHISREKTLPKPTRYHDQRIEFYKTTSPSKRSIRSLSVHNGHEELEISRQLVFPIKLNNDYFQAVVTKSQAEAEDLIMQILLLTAGAITLLLVILFLVNRFLLNNIWKPFFFTLSEMKQFNLARPEKLNRLSNNIDEFNALDATLSQMVEKVRKDYSSLKSFADNASHEMQTPLAIINSKLDLLIQDQHLNEKNMHDLQGIYESLDKLSKLNQSLLLMARIENNQFVEKKPVQLHRLIEQRLEELEELIHARGLSVITNLKPAVADMHPLLADILINNLLVNAIRHNTFEGMIKLESTANKITVINTASGTALDEKTLFDRFRKSLESDGVGLGLAIVKEICEFYQFQVSYAYLSPLHYFTFTFKNGTTGSKS